MTNRDECVTVKSPANNILIERIWCNQSGGSAIGSLGVGTAIENIVYRNVYTNGGNQIFMIKSWGGDGYVKNVLFENFLSHNTAYGLDVNQYWSSQTQAAGNGVALSNITFSVSPSLISELEGRFFSYLLLLYYRVGTVPSSTELRVLQFSSCVLTVSLALA